MKGPFCFLLIPLIVGILIGHFTGVIIPLTAMGVVVIALLAIGIYFKVIDFWIISILVVILGIVSYQLQLNKAIEVKELLKEDYQAVAKVLSEPLEKNQYWEVDLKIIKIINEEKEADLNQKSKGKIFFDYDRDLIKPGETIAFSNHLFLDVIHYHNLSGYNLYLKGNGFSSIIGINGDSIDDVNYNQGLNLLGPSNWFKKELEAILDKTLMEQQASLMKSILFGNQGYLSKDMLNSFSKSGTAHIIAISGLHIGIIVLILHKLLSLLGTGRNLSLLLTMSIILLYAYLVGFPVSIIRASSMYFILVLAYFLHRPYNSINTLAFIAFIVLLLNPITLFTVSFQLSFAATLSILTLYPLLNRLLSRIPDYIRQLLSVTIAAQLGTMPIMAYHFNEISIVAPITNLLIVPLLGVLITLAFISITIGAISIGAASIFNSLTNTILTYMIYIVRTSSQLFFSSISLQEMKPYEVFTYYFILIAIYVFINTKKNSVMERLEI
ncbi:ComEC/Rec2 family competence protein [Alkaliphilus pronyensis]|uniref:ComEC/Rec2 family competence protein n=1 Tax=Alkaliphilus pronyensis TaxID=1482732 RepID=A0A6I0FFL0_9FIRM|nr:ComEC/Rec2 family competence protein [Alkaliphilus pronyensis]KAB3539082.1 ComEC/Rec2 family competence protein [Alkaliphilus pronyensis]